VNRRDFLLRYGAPLALGFVFTWGLDILRSIPAQRASILDNPENGTKARVIIGEPDRIEIIYLTAGTIVQGAGGGQQFTVKREGWHLVGINEHEQVVRIKLVVAEGEW